MSDASRFTEPLLWFARKMALKLSKPKNVAKVHWTECDEIFLLDCLEEELGELKLALECGDKGQITDEAVDVANFAMMLADRTREDRTR